MSIQFFLKLFEKNLGTLENGCSIAVNKIVDRIINDWGIMFFCSKRSMIKATKLKNQKDRILAVPPGNTKISKKILKIAHVELLIGWDVYKFKVNYLNLNLTTVC